MSTVLADKAVINLPLSDDMVVDILILTEDDQPIIPDKVDSLVIYRMERSKSAEDSNLQTIIALSGSDSNTPLWSKDCQGIATGTIDEEGLVSIIVGPDLKDGADHHFGQDHILVDGTKVVLENERFTVSPHVDGFEITLDLRTDYSVGSVVSIAYAKKVVPANIAMISSGRFNILIDPSADRFWPGTHYAIMEFTFENERYSTLIEFELLREQTSGRSAVAMSEEMREQLLLKRLPFAFFDTEGGIDGPFGQLMKYIDEAMGRNEEIADGLTDIWSPDTAPTAILQYIAAELGTNLVGTDPVSWRAQVQNLMLRWKSKGSLKSIRERLADCGVELESFTRYLQVRSRKFRTFSEIITRNTEVHLLDEELGGAVYSIKMPQAPWVFPSFDQDRREFVPFFGILEVRAEGETTWKRIPTTSSGHAILRFRRDEVGAWFAVISPYRIDDQGAGIRSIVSIDNEASISEFTEVRITYPVAAWGIRPFERFLQVGLRDPRVRRSGFVVLRATSGSDAISVGLHDGIPSCDIYDVNSLEKIEVTEAPEPRTGFALIHYAESKAVLFGGFANDSVFDDCWLLDFSTPSTPTWTRYTGPMPPGRSGCAYVATDDGTGVRRHLIFGGWSNNGAINDAWEWDPNNETWSRYVQPTIKQTIANFSVSSGPVGETVNLSTYESVADLQVSETIGIVDASDPSRGCLVLTINSLGSNVINAEIVMATGDFATASQIETVSTWRMTWVCDPFAPDFIGGFELSGGPVGENVNNAEYMAGSTPLGIGDIRWIRPEYDPMAGRLQIQVTGTGSGTISFSILNATGDLALYENTLAVSSWIVVEYPGIDIWPSTTHLRVGHKLLVKDLSGNMDLRGYIVAKDSTSIDLELTSWASGVSYPSPSTEVYLFEVLNMEPSPRIAAATCAFCSGDGSDERRSVMVGGVSNLGEHLGDTWIFDLNKGWLQLRNILDGPVGHSGALVRVASGSTGVEDRVFIGNMCVDNVSISDAGTRVDRHAKWFELTNVFTADADDVNVSPYGAWTKNDSVTSGVCASNEVSTGFDDNMRHSQFFCAADLFETVSSARRLETLEFSGALVVSNGSQVLPASKVEVCQPLLIGVAADITDAVPEGYEIHVDNDVTSVTGTAMYDSMSFIPTSNPTQHVGTRSSEIYWDITPEYTLSLRKSVPWTMLPTGASDPRPIEDQQPIILHLSGQELFLITNELVAFCPIVEVGERCIMIGRLLDRDKNIIGFIKVLEDLTVEHTLNDRLVQGVSNLVKTPRDPIAFTYGDGVVKGIIGDPAIIPMFIDCYTAARVDDVPPMVGSYTRVAPDWYRLVAVPEGRMPRLSITDGDGNNFALATSDFAVVYSPTLRQMRLWIVSNEAPDMQSMTLELDGYFPTNAIVLPPCITSNHLQFNAINPSGFTAQLAWSRYWPESLWMEPDVLWAEPSWDNARRAIVFEVEDIPFPEKWIVRVADMDGTVREAPLSEIVLRKILRRDEHDCAIEMSFGDNFPISYGSKVDIFYPLRSSVKLSCPVDLSEASLTIAQQPLIGSDYRGLMSATRTASIIASAASTIVGVRHGAMRSIGVSGTVRPSVLLTSEARIEVDNAVLAERPFHHPDAYHAPNDAIWQIDGESLWSSLRLIAMTASSGYPESDDTYTIDLLPTYARIKSTTVAFGSAALSPWVPPAIARYALSVSTIPDAISPTDLLVAVVTQEEIPEFRDSRMIEEDWLELFVLSLPRMDERIIDKLNTYRLWRGSIVNNETPYVHPSPIVNHDTRLLDRRHPFVPLLCPEIAQAAPPIVFGRVRTEALYGRTVYNREEFDGSTKPSTDPCDIDASFVDTCTCSPGSHISWSVKIPVQSNVTKSDVERIMAEMLPAQAIPVDPHYSYQQEEPVARTSEETDLHIEMDLHDSSLTFDPRIGVDGVKRSRPAWDQLISPDYPPYATVDVTASEFSGDTSMWLLKANDAQFSRIPFSSLDDDLLPSIGAVESRAFAITNNGDARLIGIRRYGESSLLFEEDFGGSPDSSSGYSIWNKSMLAASSTASTLSDRTWIAFNKNILDPVDVKAGDKIFFRFAPSDMGPITGAYVQYSATVMQIVSTDDDVWIEMNVADVSATMPLLFNPSNRPGIMMISRENSIDAISCSLIHHEQVVDENYLRGTLVRTDTAPMLDFDSTRSQLVFNLRRNLLRTCMVLSEGDLASFPVLADASLHSYDPSNIGALSVGSKVDAFGSLATASGDKLCDFVIVDGSIKVKVAPDIGMSVVSATVNSDREITIEFTQQFSKVSITGMVAVYGSGNSSDDERVRATAVLLPRSTDIRLDVGLQHALFISGSYPHDTWRPQTSYTLRRATIVQFDCSSIGSSDLQVGDHLFFGPNYLEHYPIVKIDRANNQAFMAFYDTPAPPSGSITVMGARLAFETDRADPWVAARRSVVVDIDVLASMPPDHSDYSDVRDYAVLIIGDVTYDINAAEAGPSPGTTTLRLHTPVLADDLPANAQFLAYDIDENLATKAELAGGSQILCAVFVDDVLTETQEFN